MITIKCDVYEKNQLLQYLNYCKKKRIEECNNDEITVGLLNIELGIINNLIDRIDGKYREDYDMRSKDYRVRDAPKRDELNDFEKEVRKLTEVR